MNSSRKSKDLKEYTQSQPEQLKLFESEENYSNTIELYDSMPKYYFGGQIREKGNTVDSLPILNREFMHRQKEYKISISPAAVQDKKAGKTIYYYPSAREEVIEDVIRKIATRPNRATLFDNEVGVKFTYYEVWQELKKINHGYSIDQIKLGIEILNKSVIETTCKEGNEISITSSLFSYVGKETKEMGGKERVVVIFNPLVTKSISHGSYRLINYDKLMRMKMPLARWLHKRISHMFVQATPTNPYSILLSTIVRDSGMKSYKTTSEIIRQVEKALNQLKEFKVVSKWEKQPHKEKNKILDVLYSLYMSDKFVADAKKANRFTNMRLESDADIEDDNYSLDNLRDKLENQKYSLSKTVINNLIAGIKNRRDYEQISNGFDAAVQYIEDKKIENTAAVIRKAIKEGWIPSKKKTGNPDLFDHSLTKNINNIKEDKNINFDSKEYKELQKNDLFVQSKNEIRKLLGEEKYRKWFSDLELLKLTKDTLVFVAETKFKRDVIIRDYLEQESSNNIKNIIKTLNPEIKSIKIASKETLCL